MIWKLIGIAVSILLMAIFDREAAAEGASKILCKPMKWV